MNPAMMNVDEELMTTNVAPRYLNLGHRSSNAIKNNNHFTPHKFTIGEDWQTDTLEFLMTSYDFGCTLKYNPGESPMKFNNVFYATRREAQNDYPDHKIITKVIMEGIAKVPDGEPFGATGPDENNWQPVKIELKGNAANVFMPKNAKLLKAYEAADIKLNDGTPVIWVLDTETKISKEINNEWAVPVWNRVYKTTEEMVSFANEMWSS